MKCKNKIVKVLGTKMASFSQKPIIAELTCIITNDERGKTLSVNDGMFQFSIPFEMIEKYLK